MSMTVAQIFATNPTTTVADTDLYYLVQSPYTPGTDAAITGASLKAAFGAGGTINPGSINQLAYYAAAGTTLSGLTTGNNGVLITSAGGAPSISSTLPSAVQGNITALGTIATGVWNGSVIGGTYGGTGVNNGASTITIGGNVTFSGAFTFAGTLTGNTAVTFPTSGTLATTSQLLISPLTTKGDLWGWSTTNDRLPVGSTNGQVLQVNSAASLGLSYSTATYPTVATSAARILRADGTNWVQTTSTFADTYAASGFLYANGANNVAGLATANNGLPVTSNTGVPSILAGPGTTGNILQSNAAAAPSFSTATYPSVATGTGTLLRADGTNWVPTTSTYPNTNAVSTLLYASSANVMAALATANNGLLVTSATGVPSILAGPGTTGNMLISNAAAAPSFTTFTYPTTVGAAGSIHISNGTNIVSSTSIWPNTVGTSGKVVISDGTSNVYSTPTFPNASATTRKIIVSDGTNWVASTETYATPGSSGNVMTSDGTNWTSSSTAGTGRLIGVQVFTSNGTYTPTSGMATYISEALGSGGGGGGSAGAITTNSAAGGGGAGGYLKIRGTASDIGASKAVTIGAGGTAGTAGANNGGNGNATTLGTLWSAGGGSGGAGAASGSNAPDPLGGAGGTNTITTGTTLSNSPGMTGLNGSIRGAVAFSSSGQGASTLYGGGGKSVGGSTAGNAGTGYGSGGSGGSTASSVDTTSRAGGAGAAGYMIIYEYS